MAADGIERSRGMAAELLDAYWVAKPQPFTRRGLIVEAVAAAAFLLVSVLAALLIGGEARIPPLELGALVLAYAAASQVRFEIGSSFVAIASPMRPSEA